MQLFARSFPPDFRLVLFSDLHVGSRGTHYDGINQCLDDISRKNTWAIGLGDYAEAMTVDDHRFDANVNDLSIPTPVQQFSRVVEILSRVKLKLLYLNDGNHDYKLSRVINFISDKVCAEIGVPYGTYSSKLSILDKNGRMRIKIFTSHGYGQIHTIADDPIRRKSNERLALKRKLSAHAGDVHAMFMGHCHKLLTAHPEHSFFLADDGDKITQHRLDTTVTDDPYIHPDHRWYGCTGSFLKSQLIGCSGYAERFGYPPQPLGYLVMTVRDYKIVSLDKVRV